MLYLVVCLSFLLSGVLSNARAPHQEIVSKLDLNVENSITNPCGFMIWKQCDPRWANEPLGTSHTNTICSAGCAMSSTAMVVSTYNGNDTNWNPGTLNTWLNNHNGYVDTDLIVWSAVDPLGAEFVEEIHIPQSYIENGLKQCHGFIANVLSGTHWVLLTAYQSGENFYVNDPGFSTVNYSGMGNIVEYMPNGTTIFHKRM